MRSAGGALMPGRAPVYRAVAGFAERCVGHTDPSSRDLPTPAKSGAPLLRLRLGKIFVAQQL